MGDSPGVQQNWLIFRDHLLHAQEQFILAKGKMWTAVEWDGTAGGKRCGKGAVFSVFSAQFFAGKISF